MRITEGSENQTWLTLLVAPTNRTMDPEASMSVSFRPDTVLQALVDLTSGATLLKAGRSVRRLVLGLVLAGVVLRMVAMLANLRLGHALLSTALRAGPTFGGSV